LKEEGLGGTLLRTRFGRGHVPVLRQTMGNEWILFTRLTCFKGL